MERMNRGAVLPVAEYLQAQLAPVCQRIEIAGSLRRKKPDVKDIELVVLPKFDTDLFGENLETYSALDGSLKNLLDTGTLAWNTAHKANGLRYKRFVVPALDNIALDMFLAHREENWGNVLVIRTGDGDFIEALVTARSKRGFMPDDLSQADGCLWRTIPVGERKLVPCPTESAFFEALNLPVLPPEERNAEGLTKLRKIALTLS